MRDKFVVEFMGARQKMWVSGFHHNGKPIYTNEITKALVWTEESACIFAMESADEDDPNYWASPLKATVVFGSV